MKVFAFTNNGLKYDHNEDSYLINGASRYGEKLSGEANIYSAAVFDGVGGANAGEVASKLASQEAAKRINTLLSEEELKLIMAEVNADVVNAAQSNPELRGMACTVAGALFCKDRTLVYNVGDSKVFKIKNGLMMQLSTDDTYAAFLARAYGESIPSLQSDHRITAYLGNPQYDAEQLHLREVSAPDDGETFFICTDGVTDYINSDYLENILTDSTTTLVEKSNKISQAVFSNGAGDNFTYIILTR